jgi:hypothetical protein
MLRNAASGVPSALGTGARNSSPCATTPRRDRFRRDLKPAKFEKNDSADFLVQNTDHQVGVCDTEGKNARKIAAMNIRRVESTHLFVDWR